MSVEACVYVSEALAAAANPEKAVGMQAYMNSQMPAERALYGGLSRDSPGPGVKGRE